MLQIISGKFFQSEDRYRYDGKGILFGNYQWYGPIETCVATLEPVDIIGSVISYVVSYVNQIEKPGKGGPATLLRAGDAEIVEQFRLLSILGLQSYFHQDRESVAIACRKQPLSMSDRVPSFFVPRFFHSPVQGTEEEVAFFTRYVEKVIALPRDVYRAVLAAHKGFADALEVSDHNIDLAYSLLVFALECLSQTFDDYSPTWEDYPSEVTSVLDPILRNLGDSTAEDIRHALLRDRNLKLQKRFVDFVSTHLRKSFFIEEAPVKRRTLRKAELARALKNAYGMRSKYTHQLQPIHELLRTSGFAASEVILWEHEPYLSLAGLVRLVRHVICSFVAKQESLEEEDINWRSELPGVVQASLAPQYWIWRHDTFRPENATEKLEGFLQQIESAHVSGESISDLRDLMAAYEEILPRVNGTDKLRMLALYCAYNLIVQKDGRTENHETVIAEHEPLLEECSIEAMLVLLISEKKWPWEPRDLVKQWNLYQKQRYHSRGLAIPPGLEILLQVEIAEAYLKAGSAQRHSMWLGRALLDASGKPRLQLTIREARSNRTKISHSAFWEAACEDAKQQK
jgi:hypothetical protein